MEGDTLVEHLFVRSTARTALGILAALGLTLSLFTMVAPVMAGAPGNNGTVKVHDGATDEEPIVANEPHVCTFHLHFFFGDDVQSGDWWIESWPPTGDGTVVLDGSYDATGGEDRQPGDSDDPNVYSLADGHYKLFWEGAVNPGGQLEIKHKVFWVGCAPEESPEESPEASPEESPEASPGGRALEASPEESPEESVEASPEVSPEESVEASPEVSPEESVEASPEESPNDKIVICHAAGLDGTTKYVELELPYNAVYGQGGHFNENGTTQAGHEDDYLGPCEPEASPEESPEESPEASPEESPEESPEASPEESPEMSPEESPEASPEQSPRESTAGGNPTPTPGGGTIPDTAFGSESVPTWPLALLMMLSFGGLIYLRLTAETELERNR